jgi:hypothetical protein
LRVRQPRESNDPPPPKVTTKEIPKRELRVYSFFAAFIKITMSRVTTKEIPKRELREYVVVNTISKVNPWFELQQKKSQKGN